MNRSFFRRAGRDSSPLLPQYSSVPLAELPPRPSSDESHVSSSSPQSHQSRVQFSHPPPPITASALLQPPVPSLQPSRPSAVAHVPAPTNPLTALARREKALQADIQHFLDAQSEALLAGRMSGPAGSSAASDAGSSTPTSHTAARLQDRSQLRSGAVIPVRQPRLKKTSLRESRRGILETMLELASVKAHALSILRTESENLRTQLSRIDVWESRLAGFETEIRRISSGDDERETAGLRAEKAAVANEIRELEERLLALRARERNLGMRLEEVLNRREADLSSFREGRRGIDEEVRRFLGRPPKLDIALSIAAKEMNGPGGNAEGTLFLTLPPKRRTLSMARDWLASCLSAVSSLAASTEVEKEALEEGALSWENIINLVTIFENELRQQMQDGRGISVKDVEGQLQKTTAVIESLESASRDAASRGWNLLICAAGAELEAFREGKDVLRSTINMPGILQQGDRDGPKDANIFTDSGMIRESLSRPTLEINHGVIEQDQGHDIHPLEGFASDVGVIDNKHDSQPKPTLPIVLDGLQTTPAPQDGDDEDLQTPTVLSRREGIGPDVGAGVGAGHARSISQIYSLSPGHGLSLSRSPWDKNGTRESSPHRSESEDDGPPAALLVGLQDEFE